MSGTYTGSCNDMCPERERNLRLGFNLPIFERDKDNQPDEYAMVKEYRRAGADQEEPAPEDLRTLKALEMTMDYLVCNIMDNPKSRTPEYAMEWYDYLWDRLRAIRKDITQQGICDEPSAILVERCARFHIYTCYAMNRVKGFDVSMNKKMLNDCLQMLRQMYTDLRSIGIHCTGEIEFQKYDILLHLDDDHSTVNVLMITSDYKCSPDMKFITKIMCAYTNSDYYRFFKLVRGSDFMTSCVLSLFVNKVRLTALKMIVAACPPKQTVWYLSDLIIDSLEFDDLDDLSKFVSNFDIDIQAKDGKYYLLLHRDLVSSIRQTAGSVPPIKSWKLVESKAQGRNVGQSVYGCDQLPLNPYETNRTLTNTSLREEHDVAIINDSPMIEDPQLEDTCKYASEIENCLGHVQSNDSKLTIFGPNEHFKSSPSIIKELQKVVEINEPESVSPKIVADNQQKLKHFWHRETDESLDRVSQSEEGNDGQEYNRMEFIDSDKSKSAFHSGFGEIDSRTPEIKVINLPEPRERLPSIPIILTVRQDETVGVGPNRLMNVDIGGVSRPLIDDDSQKLLEYNARVEAIRDIMPVGKFRKSRLSKKVPYLKPPAPTPPAAIKPPRQSITPESAYTQALKNLNSSIHDEQVANSRLNKLLEMYLDNPSG